MLEAILDLLNDALDEGEVRRNSLMDAIHMNWGFIGVW